jgi:hypothetical protein
MDHFCYQSITTRVKKQACPISIGTMKLDFDASCNENGPNLSSNPTPCLLVPIIVKCSKLMTMEGSKFIDSNALACLMDKELM